MKSNGELIPVHRPDTLGAPFQVLLAASARKTQNGEIVIPDVNGMIAAVGMSRLWRDQRLSGPEIHFLRKSAGISRRDLADAIGGTEAEVESYETGPRPMTIGLEKYIRIHLFNLLRRRDGPRVDEMINYIEWTTDEWKPTFHDVSAPIEIRIQHQPTGWQEMKPQR